MNADMKVIVLDASPKGQSGAHPAAGPPPVGPGTGRAVERGASVARVGEKLTYIEHEAAWLEETLRSIAGRSGVFQKKCGTPVMTCFHYDDHPAWIGRPLLDTGRSLWPPPDR
jgi:hypothetical protein